MWKWKWSFLKSSNRLRLFLYGGIQNSMRKAERNLSYSFFKLFADFCGFFCLLNHYINTYKPCWSHIVAPWPKWYQSVCLSVGCEPARHWNECPTNLYITKSVTCLKYGQFQPNVVIKCVLITKKECTCFSDSWLPISSYTLYVLIIRLHKVLNSQHRIIQSISSLRLQGI